MKSFEPLFPAAAAPHNPYYRHSKARKGSYTSATDRFYVLVGTVVVFVLFLGYQNLGNVPPTSTDLQAGAAAALSEGKQRLRLREPQGSMETKKETQQRALSTSSLRFKIMTFNLRYAGTGDGLNGWQYRKEHVADIINRYHPAVLGTQEGLKTQLAELEAMLKHPYERFGVEREENGEFEQLFYDTEVLERLDSGDFWLSEEPDRPGTKGWDAACVRMVTWGKFRLRATQQELFVFNTQLDHMGDQSREKSSTLLWERMKRIAGDAPLFLMGDFNTYRHTSTYSFYTSQKDGPQLREAWPEAAKQIGDVSYTYHGWAGVHNDGEKNAIRAANHIDWIFYRPEMKVLTTEVITEDRNGRYPSDHYPIQAEVLFPSPAQLPPPHRADKGN